MGHAQAPTVRWSWRGEAFGEGVSVPLPEDALEGDLLEVEASSWDGALAHGTLSLRQTAQDLEITREAIAVGEDLSLSTRRDLPGQGRPHAETGEAVRISVPQARGTLRWMSAQGQGTVLELSETQADVLADEVHFENEEGAWVVAEREPGEAGIYHQLVLDLDPAGGNRWVWADVAVGLSEPLLAHHGRLIPNDVALDAGRVSAQARVVDGALALESISPVDDLSSQSPLDCAPADQAFRLDWVVDGRCGLDVLDGATLVLEIQ